MAWCKYVIISFWGCLVDSVKRLGAEVYNKRKPVIPAYLHSLADLWTCNLLHSVHRRVISECSVQLAGLSKTLSKINKCNINTLPAWLVGKEGCFCAFQQDIWNLIWLNFLDKINKHTIHFLYLYFLIFFQTWPLLYAFIQSAKFVWLFV